MIQYAMITVAAQLEIIPGDYAHNERAILEAITEATEGSADLLIFPELTIPGYPLGDLTLYSEFLFEGEAVLERVIEQIPSDLAVGIGYIGASSKDNSLANQYSIFLNGEEVYFQERSLIPESELLEGSVQGETLSLWNYKEETFAILSLGDLETENQEILTSQDVTSIIIVSSAPYIRGRHIQVREQLQEVAQTYKRPLSFVQGVGSHEDILFAGGSFCCDLHGNLILQGPLFEEALLFFNPREEGSVQQPEDLQPYEEVHKALVFGIRSYIHKSGFSTANLGLSGGIDSALVAALAVEALGPDQVHGYLMPSPYSSEGSIQDSITLAENLGMKYDIIPIEPLFFTARELLAPSIGKEMDLTEENLQARTRGLLLMAYSNRKGSMLLATGNKSEFAVGYSTLYGDLCGGLCPIGDLYKTEVVELCRYINRDEEIIPEAIITKPPSAELRPDQKDEDSLPPYPVLDDILYRHLELFQGPKEIIASGIDKEVAERVLQLVRNSEYKRRQAAPILRLSECNFGSGRNIPILTKPLPL